MPAHRSLPAFSLAAPLRVVLGLCAVAAGAAAVQQLGSPILISLSAQAAIVALLALGVGVLNRTLGLISFGHAAPFGLGAYGTAAVLTGGALPPEAGILLVLAAGMVIFFAVGLIVVRLDGIAFAMITLAIGQGVYVTATRLRAVTGGADGLIVTMPHHLFLLDGMRFQQSNDMLVIVAGVLATTYILLRVFETSRLGRIAIAIRENEERARFLGFRTHALRAFVYALSCGLACLGGVLFALYQGFVSPEILHWSFSGSALIMAILGGSAALWGPIAGACVFFFLRDALSDLTSYWLSLLGLSLIAVTVVWPAGLSGGAQRLAGRLATRRAGHGDAVRTVR